MSPQSFAFTLYHNLIDTAVEAQQSAHVRSTTWGLRTDARRVSCNPSQIGSDGTKKQQEHAPHAPPPSFFSRHGRADSLTAGLPSCLWEWACEWVWWGWIAVVGGWGFLFPICMWMQRRALGVRYAWRTTSLRRHLGALEIHWLRGSKFFFNRAGRS
jgi:hypothetical protein